MAWSARYTVEASTSPTSLVGDRILLPSTALEQLLGRDLLQKGDQTRPLVFRLANPENGRITYAGVREFSANPDQIVLSRYLQDILAIDPSKPSAPDGQHKSREIITIQLSSIPQGTYVKLRPLEAGYDVSDWKALLEHHLRDTYATLVRGQTLSVPVDGHNFHFVIDSLQPEGEAVSIIDTDLEVDIEALSEEQARETIRLLGEQRQRSGKIVPHAPVHGKIVQDQYVDYVLEAWDKQDLRIELHPHNDDDLNLFVNPMGPRQREKPRLTDHLFADYGSNLAKCVILPHLELEGAESIRISIQGYACGESTTYDLQVRNSHEPEGPKDGLTCSNCGQNVPEPSMFLHQNFCLRHNIRCGKCGEVFRESSRAWQQHWHCEYDASHGNSPESRRKHERLSHERQVCSRCEYECQGIAALAGHRRGECVGRLILCQFCHLETAQKGPGDAELDSAEVIVSGLTPHELSDGARTTECHVCGRIMRLRDLSVHLQHHDLTRKARKAPRICGNAVCGNLVDPIDGQGNVGKAETNELGLCGECFGPLYTSQYDPEGRALRRRVERKLMSQRLTGCGNAWCRNPACRTANRDPVSQEGHFCVDERRQKRRDWAEMLAAEGRFSVEWCVAALSVKRDDVEASRAWLGTFAPTQQEA